MSGILTQPVPQIADEQEAILNELFTKMHRINELMKQDQAAIDNLKVETDVLRMETRAILARLGQTI
jgi:hypothetical protein